MDITPPLQVHVLRAKTSQTLSSPEYLLVLALSEGLTLHGVEDSSPKAGSLVFLSPFAERTLRLSPGSQVLYAVIPAGFLEPLLGIPKRAVVTLLQDGADEVRGRLIEYYDATYNQAPSKLEQLRITFALLSALKPFITTEITVSAAGSPSRKIAHITEYVENHFREPLQLQDLADAFGVTSQYVSMLFQRKLGMSFTKYLLELRLREAYRLLLTTQSTITEISEASGFPNLKAFTTAFRARHGVSPRDFRKQNADRALEQEGGPGENLLQDVNKLLRPYRLVYQKQESSIQLADEVTCGRGVLLEPKWNILNVDNAGECLQSSKQATLTAIQQELSFRYVRLHNLFTQETTPYMPAQGRHRFTAFLEIIDFFRRIGLTPMLVLGEAYRIMIDGRMQDEGYNVSPEDWYRYLGEILEVSVGRWGADWVSQWRFEFYMPAVLYGEEAGTGFMELLERSVGLVRAALPAAEVGGPGLPVDAGHLGRLRTWFGWLKEHPLDLDFISIELMADYTEKTEGFSGQFREYREIRTLDRLQDADLSLPAGKVAQIRAMMAQAGCGERKLYASALGITKYQATAAQAGGHCSAYLVKTNLELNDLVDGIGCWKALNSEAEYLDEYHVLGSGCGLVSRRDLKSVNWYAQVFLTGLMPYKLSQGLGSFVTTDRQGSYAALIHNCKNYSPYFYRHYLDKLGLDFTNTALYASNVAMVQTIRFYGIVPGRYRVEQHLIGDHHGCLAAVMEQMGQVQLTDEHDISYLAGQSLPYQHSYVVEASDTLEFTVTIQPNEVMLLRISPERPRSLIQNAE